jgi:hypothetical protein
MQEIESLTGDIERAQKLEEAIKVEAKKVTPRIKKTPEEKALERWSFGKAVRDICNGKLEGVEAELDQEARREFSGYADRTINLPSKFVETRTDIDQTTSGIQPTTVSDYVDALRENSVYERVGMNVIEGLQGDYKIPTVGKHAFAWASAENASAGDVGVNFGKDTLSPVRFDRSGEFVH